jgi:hypothetical protein
MLALQHSATSRTTSTKPSPLDVDKEIKGHLSKLLGKYKTMNTKRKRAHITWADAPTFHHYDPESTLPTGNTTNPTSTTSSSHPITDISPTTTSDPVVIDITSNPKLTTSCSHPIIDIDPPTTSDQQVIDINPSFDITV